MIILILAVSAVALSLYSVSHNRYLAADILSLNVRSDSNLFDRKQSAATHVDFRQTVLARLDALDAFVSELPTFDDVLDLTDSSEFTASTKLVQRLRDLADAIEADPFASSEAEIDDDQDDDQDDEVEAGSPGESESTPAEVAFTPGGPPPFLFDA